MRGEELLRSARLLGIPPDHIQIINDRQLPDSPGTEWDVVYLVTRPSLILVLSEVCDLMLFYVVVLPSHKTFRSARIAEIQYLCTLNYCYILYNSIHNTLEILVKFMSHPGCNL